MFEACCRGPQIVVGSSMGGWLALLLVRSLAQRAVARATVAGLVLIAPAVDFTEELLWKRFPPDLKRAVEETGGGRNFTVFESGFTGEVGTCLERLEAWRLVPLAEWQRF